MIGQEIFILQLKVWFNRPARRTFDQGLVLELILIRI